MVAVPQHKTASTAVFEACDSPGLGHRIASNPLLNFLQTIFDVVTLEEEDANEYPNGFFARVVKNVRTEPSLIAAIEAWFAETVLLEETPQADGLLGTAATEAERMARALMRVAYPGDSQEGDQQ